MSTHKRIDRICWGITALTLALTILFVNGKALGIAAMGKTVGYEERLFDTGRVHTIDIVMDDWEGFLQTCENEEYTLCSVVIDGESRASVGLRAKGNTSLTTVSSLGSSRYSFKLEFDHYDSGKSYHGLDKLSLNNIIQDNTYLKDYLTYQMMNAFGVASPLCSFAFLTVNGEDWGLYLAVEGVEDGFLQRNYGGGGQLYKPDSIGFGGGRGNGRGFDMEGLEGQLPQPGGQDGGFEPKDWDFSEPSHDRPTNLPEDGQAGRMPAGPGQEEPAEGQTPENGGFPGGFGGGMGSADVKLQYIDDDPDSYPNIFDNAKTDPSQADQHRLIQSLYQLSQGERLEEVLDKEAVLRYFVVHNFVVNGDSYTGSIIHNYYLYEGDGQLSMIPWDYNLAFGTFQAGDAKSAINDPIDQALEDRPMQSWIFADEQDTSRYHQLYQEFLEQVDASAIIDQAAALIGPYVERDPTKFCTTEEFYAGVTALKEFCRLRTQSVQGQLTGEIPSTTDGQRQDPDRLIDGGTLDLSAMGTMNMGGGHGNRGNFPGGNMDGQPAGAPVSSESSQTEGEPQTAPAKGGPFEQAGRENPDRPGEGQGGEASGGYGGLGLLAGSAALLAAGLVFVRRFRR